MRKEKICSINIEIFDNLIQNYEAEFSEITGKKADSQGRYALDVDISDDQPGYLLFEEDTPIGFAVLGKQSGKNDVAEFYIVPDFRRQDFGKKFAFEIFDMYPGSWQVRQIEGAEKARCFWRAVIKEYTCGNYVDTF